MPCMYVFTTLTLNSIGSSIGRKYDMYVFMTLTLLTKCIIMTVQRIGLLVQYNSTDSTHHIDQLDTICSECQHWRHSSIQVGTNNNQRNFTTGGGRVGTTACNQQEVNNTITTLTLEVDSPPDQQQHCQIVQ